MLLAEDNDLNAELATILLEDSEMIVTRAADGQEVVDLFANHPAGTYDIILMDIMMPKMDGLQAAKAIRAMQAERPDEEIPSLHCRPTLLRRMCRTSGCGHERSCFQAS